MKALNFSATVKNVAPVVKRRDVMTSRDRVLLADLLQPLHTALAELEMKWLLDDLDGIYQANKTVSLLLGDAMKRLNGKGLFYLVVKTYRSRTRTVQQFYRHWKKEEKTAKEVSNAAFTLLRGNPFYPDKPTAERITKKDPQEKRSAS